ncbi:beta-phosphoglucomutase [Zhouia sp. PK063]|uniref:beta-phosphoglucomutase n=1 Tax=Zhouia sp. PK063 TaxID=3373602 RepID=UPI0037AC70AF
MKKTAFIFDLDGVIVDTAKYHFLAWKKTAKNLGFNLTHEQNEQLKGVSRIASLHKILNWGNVTVSDEKFKALAHAKNEDYLTYVEAMTSKEILPGVAIFLEKLKQEKYPIALGSASKNAIKILKKINLYHMFDVVIDGNLVSKAKPDPEVFLLAAQQLNVLPENCIVFEDAEAGIAAAKSANMLAVGLGNVQMLRQADYIFSGIDEIDEKFLKNVLQVT